MKICITTTFDRNYALAGRTLFKSIRRHTDCTGIDFKVITADPEIISEFGEENCHVVTDEIKAKYAGVEYSALNPANRYSSSWYRYEMFNLDEYERVICIDADCICPNDISYLFSKELNQYDLISVEDYIISQHWANVLPQLEAQGLNLRGLRQRLGKRQVDVQAAILVANKSIVNRAWYDRLLSYANTANWSYAIDMGVLNDFIYQDEQAGLKIKLLPVEWDYQDVYEEYCPKIPVPAHPRMVHCQQSKPFKNDKATLPARLHKWHDRWWNEHNHAETKTIVAVLVWNRFANLRHWLQCWKHCDQTRADLVVVHNQETDNQRYEVACREEGVRYVPRENIGLDIGAFRDICREQLYGFPNDWTNMLWFTDDCFPMQADFVPRYLDAMTKGNVPCYAISNEVKRHIRTTGFLVTKEISRKLVFRNGTVLTKDDCYDFEHRGFNLYEQIMSMGLTPQMVDPNVVNAPVWDSGMHGLGGLLSRHRQVFGGAQ